MSNLNIFSKIQNLQLFQSEMNYSHDIFWVNIQKIATIVTLIFDFLKNGSKIQNLQLFQSEMNYSHDIFWVNLQKIATIVTLIFDFLKNGSKMTFLENRF